MAMALHPATGHFAMDNAIHESLRSLVRGGCIAALGTLDKGEPFVSMVPYVLHGELPAFLIHVSGLSAHTRHMLERPRVSLMVTAAEDSADAAGNRIEPQALPRVTVQGTAAPLDKSGAGYASGRAAYLERFPTAAQMFELADFSLFTITPLTVRFIAGFGRAHSLTPEDWSRAFHSIG